MKVYGLLLAAALVAAALVAATAGGVSAAVPERTEGVALLSAMVRGNGTLSAASSGVVSVERSSTGSYTVTFSRDITACTFVVSISNDAIGIFSNSTAVASRVMVGNIVSVYTANSGVATDGPFGIIVFCAK